MKFLDSVLAEYVTADPEAGLLFCNFDEGPGSKVLEVGAHDAPISSMLAKCGFNVTGVDLRDCDQEQNYRHVKGDFCALPAEFLRSEMGTFDSAVSISALEHFGLKLFVDGRTKSYYDVVAARMVYDLLKPDGTFYVSVPYGGKFVEVSPHWRVYDCAAFMDRIVQDFAVDTFYLEVCEDFIIDRLYKVGEQISMVTAQTNMQGVPYVSVFAKLRKPS